MEDENNQAFTRRLAQIEADSALTVLASMDHFSEEQVTQYIVYTDYRDEGQQQKTNSIYVYTPYANTDKFGHSKVDFQAQLLFETNHWKQKMHITVLETLGAESRLAFYNFQNLGLAQLAMKAFENLANRLEIQTIDGNISTFDRESYTKIAHILEKFGYQVIQNNPDETAGTFIKRRA